MITVKLTTPNYPLARESFLKQTPGQLGRWGEVQFFLNEEAEACDYWVVFEDLPKVETTLCPKEHTIFITGEPSSGRTYAVKFLNQFSRVITSQRRLRHPHIYHMLQGHVWFPKKDYDELLNNNAVDKSKMLSVVVSNKSGTPGHKRRLEFCLKLKKHFGDRVDIFGRGINDFDDKWEVLAPYKYSIAIENSVERDYVTEKIGDCFTTLTFPFYYGCPNISDYYNPESYALIDIDDFEGSCHTIEDILNDDGHYGRHLEALIESKLRYINQYSLIPLVVHFIEKEYQRELAVKLERVTLVPMSHYKESLLERGARWLQRWYDNVK